MKIDYSVSQSAKYVGYVHVPFIHGVRHFILAFSSEVKIDLVQKIKHFIKGFLKLIPFFGAFLTFYDKKINENTKKVIYITANTPYERGRQFGELLRSETQEFIKQLPQKSRKTTLL